MSRNRERSALLANAGYLLGARGLESLLRAGYALFLAGLLGPELYGLFNFGVSGYLAFLPLGIWGMSAIIAREVVRDPRGSGRQILGVTFGLRLVTSLLAAALCLGLALVAEETDARLVSAGFALALLGRSLAVWANDVLVAHGRAGRVFRVQSPLRLFEVAAGIGVLYAGLGLWGVLWIHILSWWLQAIVGFAAVHREAGGIVPDFRLDAMRPIIRQGVPLAVLDLANAWLLQGPIVLSGQGLLDRADLGQLALAMQIYLLGQTLMSALAVASLPMISRAAADNRGDEFGIAVWVAKFAMLFAAVMALGGGLAGPWLVESLFADRYAQAGALVGPVLWMLVLAALSMGTSQLLLARRHDYAAMGSTLAGAATMAASIMPLVTAFGPLGAILAATLGWFVKSLLAAGLLLRLEKRTLLPELGRPLVLISLVSFGFFQARSFDLLFATLGSLALLIGGWLLWVLDEAQRKTISGLLSGRGNG